MTVYVDPLQDYGWIVLGQRTRSCHMFSDAVDLTELHDLAGKIGMRLAWFQDKVTAPHYDLRRDHRDAAVRVGAVTVDRRTAARIWRARRERLRDAGER